MNLHSPNYTSHITFLTFLFLAFLSLTTPLRPPQSYSNPPHFAHNTFLFLQITHHYILLHLRTLNELPRISHQYPSNRHHVKSSWPQFCGRKPGSSPPSFNYQYADINQLVPFLSFSLFFQQIKYVNHCVSLFSICITYTPSLKSSPTSIKLEIYTILILISNYRQESF